MADSEPLDPRKVTFSQAQSYEELPGPLALEELSDDARRELWDVVFASVGVRHMEEYGSFLDDTWALIFETIHRDFLKQPMDQYTSKPDTLETYRGFILYGLEFNKVFDLLQMIMRHPNCPPEFSAEVAEVFRRCRLAYVVDTNRPATILPAATMQEGETIREAIQGFQAAGLQGAEAQLRKAAALINQGDWAGSVRESIHAVESVARQLDPAASSKLGPALTSLEKRGHLHPALKEALSKLYGYTSDEKGIRHSLMDSPTSPVGRDEAVFMLGACASFASYLWRRHQGGS